MSWLSDIGDFFNGVGYDAISTIGVFGNDLISEHIPSAGKTIGDFFVDMGAGLGIGSAKEAKEAREQGKQDNQDRILEAFSVDDTVQGRNFMNGKYSSLGWLNASGQGYWADMSAKAAEDYESMYGKSLTQLKGFTLSDEDRSIIYNAAVSDNYATAEAKEKYGMSNITVDTPDGHKIDWSETQTMKKTKLADGKFVNGLRRFETDVEDTSKLYQDVAGGVVTYVGQSPLRSVANDHALFGSDGLWDTGFTTDSKSRGQICHYEGYLGSFDFDTTVWQLGYYQKIMPDNSVVEVPCLHYKLSESVSRMAGDSKGVKNAQQFKIPDGLKIADYMFADTGITTAPDLSETDIESAHGMFMNCDDLVNVGDEQAIGGGMQMPKKLKDASWMFAGCTSLLDHVHDFPSNLIDARYMFQDCKHIGYSVQWQKEDGTPCEKGIGTPVLIANDFKFKATLFGNTKFLTDYFVQNMYDGTNTDVLKALVDYQKANGGEDTVQGWASDESIHNGIYDRLENGCYDPELMASILQNGSRSAILKLIDVDSQGLSGVASRTNGMMSEAVQLTDNGDFVNDTTWASLLQTDLSGSYNKENQFGELLDRGVMALGVFGLGKKLTGNKWVGLGLAGASQLTGFAAKITPLLDGAADMIGDNVVGNTLRKISDKLKMQKVDWHTKVEELNLDEVFQDQKDASAGYAVAQMDGAMDLKFAQHNAEVDTFVAAEYDVTGAMRANGESIAEAGNLITIALTPDVTFQRALDSQLMGDSVACISDKLATEVEAAGGMTEEIRDKYSSYYMTLLTNLGAYSDGASVVMHEKYQYNEDSLAKATCGLGKVMRNTALPVYEELSRLNEKYPGFITELQMDVLEDVRIEGLPSFREYNQMDMTVEARAEKLRDGVDVYVEELEANRAKFEAAMEAATNEEEREAAFKEYYEGSYQYLIDEATAQGVVIDTRGAKTTEEKENYALTAQEKEAEAIKREEEAKKAAENQGAGIPETSVQPSVPDVEVKPLDTPAAEPANKFATAFSDAESSAKAEQKPVAAPVEPAQEQPSEASEKPVEKKVPFREIIDLSQNPGASEEYLPN